VVGAFSSTKDSSIDALVPTLPLSVHVAKVASLFDETVRPAPEATPTGSRIETRRITVSVRAQGGREPRLRIRDREIDLICVLEGDVGGQGHGDGSAACRDDRRAGAVGCPVVHRC
jgi:hypothetical protein